MRNKENKGKIDYISIIAPILSVVVFVGIWTLSSKLGIARYLSSPTAVVAEIATDWHKLLADTWATMVRAVSGFALGSILGVGVALLMGWNSYAQASLNPLVVIGKPIPALSLIPIFILWLGTGENSQILYVTVGVFFIMVVVTVEAMRNVPPVYKWAASSLGADSRTLYLRVVFPAMLPGIVGGLRVAATTAFPLTLAAEFLGAQTGLGYYLINAMQLLQVPKMIAGVLGITLLAILADLIVRAVGYRLTAWHEGFHGS